MVRNAALGDGGDNCCSSNSSSSRSQSSNCSGSGSRSSSSSSSRWSSTTSSISRVELWSWIAQSQDNGDGEISLDEFIATCCNIGPEV